MKKDCFDKKNIPGQAIVIKMYRFEILDTLMEFKLTLDTYFVSLIVIGLLLSIMSLILSILVNERCSTNLWNKVCLKQNNNDNKTLNSYRHIYVIHVVYFHRKSSIDFKKTKVMITFFVGTTEKISIQITPKFFRPNMYNETSKDYCVMKFLLFRNSEIKSVKNIAITHDDHKDGAEFYVSMISIQNTKQENGFICCIEQRIKSMPKEKCEQSPFPASPQSNMRLEGGFATPNCIRFLDLVPPMYLSFNLLFRECIDTNNDENNYVIGIYAAIRWFFVVFGSTGVIYGIFYQILAGKPIRKFIYVMITFLILCIIIAICVAIKSVQDFQKHDHLANEIRKTFHIGSAIIAFYGIPMIMIYIKITKILFGNQ
ncbi:uncharacterized protein LOC124491390 [Dermatophagoides farinae]|nr:uncharacterized protein LOC124491390 [Dermatophagoides farinae]